MNGVMGKKSVSDKMECCVCRGKGYKRLFEVEGMTLVSCKGCGLIFFKDFKGKDYGRYDISDYEKNMGLFYYYQNIIADIVTRHRKTGSLFDIGAGVGILVDIMRKRGWKADAIEASKDGVDFAKKRLNVDMTRGDFLKADIKAQYDVVVSNHVIEHVYDPNIFLQKAGKILKDRGLLVLGMPNAGCIEFRIFGKRWISLAPGQHIWHFTPETITKLLGKNYFRVKDIIIEQPRREFSTIPKKIVGNASYIPFRVLMNIAGKGSNMFVVAEKNE